LTSNRRGGMEVFAKIIRALVFPFRFLYLLVYQWNACRKRNTVLEKYHRKEATTDATTEKQQL